ncbi:MAG: histidine phosphatase family protein [Bacteroidales bacterium]|nr:histidine phosphatase family protein [Bacteroidales bacterium]
MVIYLIRHSMPDVQPDVCYGQSDVGVLKWHFERTVKRLKKQLILKKNVDIFSSPAKRCVQLARALSKSKCRVKVDWRIMELNFGSWEMKSWEDIDDDALLSWCKDVINEKVPDGESYAQLYERACDFWRWLTAKEYEEAVICTHGGVIKAILTCVLEMPLKNSLSFQFRYGDAIRIEWNGHHPSLVEFISRDS